MSQRAAPVVILWPAASGDGSGRNVLPEKPKRRRPWAGYAPSAAWADVIELPSPKAKGKPMDSLQKPSSAPGRPRQVKHNTFWHWQQEDSNLVLVPTKRGASLPSRPATVPTPAQPKLQVSSSSSSLASCPPAISLGCKNPNRRKTVTEICGARKMQKKRSLKYIGKLGGLEASRLSGMSFPDNISAMSSSEVSETSRIGSQRTESEASQEVEAEAPFIIAQDLMLAIAGPGSPVGGRRQEDLTLLPAEVKKEEQEEQEQEPVFASAKSEKMKKRPTIVGLAEIVQVEKLERVSSKERTSSKGSSRRGSKENKPAPSPLKKVKGERSKLTRRSNTSSWAWDLVQDKRNIPAEGSGQRRSGSKEVFPNRKVSWITTDPQDAHEFSRAVSTGMLSAAGALEGRRRLSTHSLVGSAGGGRRTSIFRGSLMSEADDAMSTAMAGSTASSRVRRRSLVSERKSRMQGDTQGGCLRSTTLRFETREYGEIRKVFERHMDADHMVLCDSISSILKEIRYRDVREDWIRELCERRVGNRSFVELDDFVQIIDGYQRMHMEELYQDFQLSQQSRRGALSIEETALLLEQQGFVVVPCILRELLREVKHFGDAETAAVRSHDYVHLREIFQYRGGFTAREAEESRNLFDRYDQNHNGRMDAEELCSALRWLGLSLQEGSEADVDDGRTTLDKQLERLTEGMDLETEGLSYEDFLQVLRRHRERETLQGRKLFQQAIQSSSLHAVDLNGAVDVMIALGYRTTSHDVVEESAREIGIDPEVASLSFDNFWMIFRQVRKNEGFLEDELHEFEDAFHAHDTDGSGAVDVVELGGTLRWLGYPITVEEQQDLMDDADIDKSGEVDFDEFLKIMRWYKEKELEQVQHAVATYDQDKNGTMDSRELQCLLVSLGYYILTPPQQVLLDEMTNGGGDLACDEVPRLIKQLSHINCEEFRKSHGYHGEELERLAKEFEAADKDHSGGIAREEIASLFQSCWVGPYDREAASRLIAKVDCDGDDMLDFWEFLHLMRLFQDRADYAQVLTEQKAAADAGYNHSEVRDLRKIFKIADSDASKKLSLKELDEMLGRLLELSSSLKRKLTQILRELGLENTKGMDFSDFLKLMRRLQDSQLLEDVM